MPNEKKATKAYTADREEVLHMLYHSFAHSITAWAVHWVKIAVCNSHYRLQESILSNTPPPQTRICLGPTYRKWLYSKLVYLLDNPTPTFPSSNPILTSLTPTLTMVKPPLSDPMLRKIQTHLWPHWRQPVKTWLSSALRTIGEVLSIQEKAWFTGSAVSQAKLCTGQRQLTSIIIDN